MQYQFGDQDLAAQRLAEVARVFEPTTREFLASGAAIWTGQNPPTRSGIEDSAQSGVFPSNGPAIDLGCGPGFTTQLIADVFALAEVQGLDTSERFLTLAGQRNDCRLAFHRHDVQETPFPMAPAGLIYCRFLLSHLPRPDACLVSWASQIQPGGLLMIEEVEAIETTEPVFADYLSTVDSMLKSQGTDLYVGPILVALDDPRGLRRRTSRAPSFPVSNRDAARMFSMNVPNWRDRPFVRDNYGAAEMDRLEKKLREIASISSDTSEIEWTLRQVIYERQA